MTFSRGNRGSAAVHLEFASSSSPSSSRRNSMETTSLQSSEGSGGGSNGGAGRVLVDMLPDGLTRTPMRSIVNNVNTQKTATAAASKKVKVARHLQSAPPKRLVHATEKSVALPFLVSVIAVFLAIVFGVPLMIALVLIVYPFAVFVRFALNKCSRLCAIRAHRSPNGRRSPHDEVMSPQDSFWMTSEHQVEGDGRPRGRRSNPVSVTLLFFEGGSSLGLAKIRELLLRRVVLAEDGRSGRRLYPRFSQRIVPLLAGYCWTEDHTFDIAIHVNADVPTSARTRRGLERYLGALIDRPLSMDRPPWEVQLLSNYNAAEAEAEAEADADDDDNDDDDRETVLIVRTHHSLSDAISLVKILRVAVADMPTTTACIGSASHYGYCQSDEKQRFGGTAYPLNVFRAFIVGPMTLLSWLLFCRNDCNLLRHGDQHASDTKVVTWSDDISLSQVTRIKQVSRSTLNDVVMAALAGSLRLFFQRNGISRPHKIKASVPVDLRYDSPSTKRRVRMGSKYAFVNVTLPVHREGAIPVLWEVRSIVEDEIKTCADSVVMYGVVCLLGVILPRRVSRWLIDRVLDGATLAFTNIPGPERPVHVFTMRLKSMVCLVPARETSSRLSVTVTTNADVLKLALAADAAVLPCPQQIIDDFVAQLEVMSQLLSSRRIPGEHRRRSYFIIAANTFSSRSPPVEEVQNKLYTVQEELHEISQRLEASSLSGDACSARDRAELAASQQILLNRMDRLKEEFSDLLLELRRRKSVVDGVPISDEDEDMDGEIRRPRKRALSISSRRSSVTSTARPLTTSTPCTSHHSALVTASAVGYDPMTVVTACSVTSDSPSERR